MDSNEANNKCLRKATNPVSRIRKEVFVPSQATVEACGAFFPEKEAGLTEALASKLKRNQGKDDFPKVDPDGGVVESVEDESSDEDDVSTEVSKQEVKTEGCGKKDKIGSFDTADGDAQGFDKGRLDAHHALGILSEKEGSDMYFKGAKKDQLGDASKVSESLPNPRPKAQSTGPLASLIAEVLQLQFLNMLKVKSESSVDDTELIEEKEVTDDESGSIEDETEQGSSLPLVRFEEEDTWETRPGWRVDIGKCSPLLQDPCAMADILIAFVR
ncbi:hypothetical protein U1Q18_040792 [Sarracenia purpurea var. burkii]